MIRPNATVLREGYLTSQEEIEGPWVHYIQPDAKGQGARLYRWFEQLPEGKRVLLVDDAISEVQS